MVRREVQEMGTAEMAEGSSHGWITTPLACVGQWLGEGHKVGHDRLSPDENPEVGQGQNRERGNRDVEAQAEA
jgi:hypothetical protein